MNRKVIDTKNFVSGKALNVVNFVHELTLQGYVPDETQTRKSFGDFVVVMVKYAPETEAPLPVTIPEEKAKDVEVKAKPASKPASKPATKPATKPASKPVEDVEQKQEQAESTTSTEE